VPLKESLDDLRVRLDKAQAERFLQQL